MKSHYDSISPASLSGQELDALLAAGWFRMHQRMFTATHLSYDDYCRVHWLRYPLDSIKDQPSHRQIRKKNKSFLYRVDDFRSLDTGHMSLYDRYRKSINFGAPQMLSDCLFDDVTNMENIFRTQCISVFDRDKLIAVGYVDLGDDSAAAILNFYDPDYKRHSLGKYVMLLTVDLLKTRGYKFYYPGYLLAGKPKMDYKLFLGTQVAQFYNPETTAWEAYHKGLHLPENLNEADRPDEMIDLDEFIRALEAGNEKRASEQ